MAKKYEYPKTVPVLEAEDFCQGRTTNERGQCCLIGHACKVFISKSRPHTTDYVYLPLKVRQVLAESISEHTGKETEVSDWGVFNFNDSHVRTMGELATVWNRAMAKLGYVVGNPEAA